MVLQISVCKKNIKCDIFTNGHENGSLSGMNYEYLLNSGHECWGRKCVSTWQLILHYRVINVRGGGENRWDSVEPELIKQAVDRLD